MNQCQECEEVFKYDRNGRKQREHYERFHALPKMNKNGTVTLNAIHQIVLILKNKRNWKAMLKYEEKLSKRFGRVDEDAIKSIKELRQFEKANNIEFQYHKDELSFSNIKEQM